VPSPDDDDAGAAALRAPTPFVLASPDAPGAVATAPAPAPPADTPPAAALSDALPPGTPESSDGGATVPPGEAPGPVETGPSPSSPIRETATAPASSTTRADANASPTCALLSVRSVKERPRIPQPDACQRNLTPLRHKGFDLYLEPERPIRDGPANSVAFELSLRHEAAVEGLK